MKFRIELFDEMNKIQVAIFDSTNTSFIWEKDGTNVFPEAADLRKVFPSVESISPHNPGVKSNAPSLIKIQLGLACNYSCHYCSQSLARNEMNLKLNEQLKKTDSFLDKFHRWFNNFDQDTTIEFWGGETLLYWPAIKQIATDLSSRYKNIKMGLFTNGSLITNEIIDDAVKYKIHFVISHDGVFSEAKRGKDPFNDPKQLMQIKNLFNKLQPLNLISFNSTLNHDNYSHLKIRDYIAEVLNVDKQHIKLSSELHTAYDKKNISNLHTSDTNLVQSIYSSLLEQYPFNLSLGNLDTNLLSFFSSVESNRLLSTYSQKCTMDLPSSITIDLDGNVLTCQNVAPREEHLLGNLNQPNEIKLASATHFLNRQDCTHCPVVNICQGSCMYLKDDEWNASCEHHFKWSLAFLAFIFKITLNLELKKITGNNLRNKNINEVNVL